MGVDFNKKGFGGGAAYTFVSPDNSIDITEVDKEVQLQVNRQVTFTFPVSSDPAIDNAKYNDFGLLTDDVTITYPATEPGEVKIYYGKFQVDVNNTYSVDFGNVQLVGDTEMHPYSTYLFQIIGDYCILKEVRYNGFFGKVINGFSGDYVVVSINGTNENIDVDSDGWFFKVVEPTTTSIKFNTTDNINFEKIFMSGVKSKLTSLSQNFSGCSNLSILDVKNLDLSICTSLASCFAGCTALTNIDVSNWNTEKVTTMASMFSNCTALTNIDVSNWNTEKVTTMASMFSGCTNLLNIDLSNIKAYELTTVSSMFQSCQSLLSVILFGTENKIANFSSMFLGCKALTTIEAYNLYTSFATNFNSMFSGCKALTNIDVSNWNTEKVTNMASMFNQCDVVTNIDVSNWNTGNVTSMALMFNQCKALTNIDVSNWNTGKVTTISNMFNFCKGLTSIDLSSFKTTLLTDVSNLFTACSNVVTINLDNWLLNTNVNKSQMFSSTSSLTTIYLRNSDATTYNLIDSVKPSGATIVTA